MTPATSSLSDAIAREPLLSPADVARQIQVSGRTLRYWRASGVFPQPDLAIGRTVRWQQTTIDAWLQDHQKSVGR